MCIEKEIAMSIFMTVARWLLRLLCYCKSVIALRLVLVSVISTAVSVQGHVRCVLINFGGNACATCVIVYV